MHAKQCASAQQKSWGRRIVLASASAIALLCFVDRAAAAPLGDCRAMRVIESGHSLTDPIVPVLNAMLAAECPASHRPLRIERSTVPGSPMEWRWNHHVQPGPDARHDIAAYDVLVITERASLANTVPWHDSQNMALRWTENSWRNGRDGKGAATVLYATWVSLNSGPGTPNPYNDPEAHLPFRERLPLEMTRWQAIADHVNAGRPDGAPVVRVIPGPLLMAAAYDAIKAGEAPGLTTIEDLFSDDIHLSSPGAYLIALAHFSVLYDIDPRTLSKGLGGVSPRNPETAAWMKQLVHEVLLAYPDAHYQGAGRLPDA